MTLSVACEQLIHQWRQKARRFLETRDEECAQGDDEWYLYEVDAHRLEQCADELEAALESDLP